MGGKRAHGGRTCVESGDSDATRDGLEQAVQQLGERRLAGPVLPHDPQDLTGAHREVDVVDGGAARAIGKADALELDDGGRSA